MDTWEKLRIDAGKEWAIIGINETSGDFFAQTSLGNFTYFCPPTRRGVALKKFIATVGFDYFSEKAFRGEVWCFDYKETIKCARKMIKEAQALGYISKDEARQGRDLVLKGSRRDENEFLTNLLRMPQRDLIFGQDDWWHFIQTKRNQDLVQFEKTLWPALKARLLEGI